MSASTRTTSSARTPRPSLDFSPIRRSLLSANFPANWVESNGRAKVVYFDGLEFPLTAALAARVPREVATLAIDALASNSGAQEELRARFSRARERCPAAVARAINIIAHDP